MLPAIHSQQTVSAHDLTRAEKHEHAPGAAGARRLVDESVDHVTRLAGRRRRGRCRQPTMGFDEVREGFRRGFDFRGRSNRSEYWNFYAGSVFIWFGWIIVGGLIEHSVRGVPFLWDVLSAPALIFFAWMTVCQLAVLVRRFHDSNRSAWWLLAIFAPVVNLVIFLLFLLSKGDAGPNRYGAPSPGSPYGRPGTGSAPGSQQYGSPTPTWGAPPPQ